MSRPARPSLYLALLQRHLADGMSWVQASEHALIGVSDAYELVKQSVLGPPALNGPPRRTRGEVA